MRYQEIHKSQRDINEANEIKLRGEKYKLYRELWYKADNENYLPEHPLHVDIELSGACNLRCRMCHHGVGEGVKTAGFMDRKLAFKLIDQCAELEVYSIKFNWRGEVTLNTFLPEACEYAKKKGILEVQINTNGLPVKKGILVDCAKSGMDRIIFSVDGFSKETYEDVRVGGDYDKLLKNIEEVLVWKNKNKAVKPFIRVQMVRTNINAHEVEGYIKFWSGRVDDVRVTDVTNRGQGDFLSVGDQVTTGRRRCPQPFQRLTIGYDGKVSPCCVDWFQNYIVGDSNKEALKVIWDSEKMNCLREAMDKKEHDKIEICKKCTVKESYTWKKI